MHADQEQTLEWFQVATHHYRSAPLVFIRVHPRRSVAKKPFGRDVRQSRPAESVKAVASQQCAEESPGSTEQGAR